MFHFLIIIFIDKYAEVEPFENYSLVFVHKNSSRPKPNSLVLVHRPKTGGTALSYFLNKCTPKIINNSRPSKLRSTSSRSKHAGFPEKKDAVTIFRHPVDRLLSNFCFTHSGTELTKKGIAGGGRQHAIMNSTQLRFMINDDFIQKRLRDDKNYENILKKRLQQTKYKTHILLTEYISETSTKMFRELGYKTPEYVAKKHFSNHPNYTEVFSKEEINKYENEVPIYMGIYKTIENSKEKYLLNARLA